MIHEIQAKTLVTTVRHPGAWFGARYNMNIYRGCEHQCIYCDSRSECYGIENFADVLVKVNAIELLERELAHKRIKGVVGTGAMSDPYTPVELKYDLTGQALRTLLRYGFGAHLVTKSDLIRKDAATLAQIAARTSASVAFTVTTADDGLARKLEPGAPVSSARFQALAELAAAGVYTGVTLMPVLPWIEDNEENITAIVERTQQAGGRFVIAFPGLSLRDRQRDYLYRQLDHHFPGLRARYEERYGERYSCPVPNAARLDRLVHELGARLGLVTHMADLAGLKPAQQLRLL
jgi:DNA repair photolyase